MTQLPVGRASMRCGQFMVVGLGLASLVAQWAPPANGEPLKVTDFDRRAARALYNSVRPGSVVAPERLTDRDVMNLDLYTNTPSAGTTAYLLRHGKVDDQSDPRGHFKIAVGFELSDLTKATPPWKLRKVDPATGAEVLYRPAKGSVNNELEWGARRKIGPLTLSTSQRLPGSMELEKATATTLVKYRTLLANAQENKLLGRIAIYLMVEGQERMIEAGESLPIDVSSTTQAVKVPMRVMLVDAQNKPITGMVKRFSLTPTGPLGKFMRIEGQGVVKPTGKDRYEFTDTDMATFDMVLAPSKGTAFEQEIIRVLEAGGGGAVAGEPSTIALSVGVKYR